MDDNIQKKDSYDDESDDDVSLDFSKVKNVFKKSSDKIEHEHVKHESHEHAKHEHVTHETAKHEYAKHDSAKQKSLHTYSADEDDSDDSDSFDFSKIKTFFKSKDKQGKKEKKHHHEERESSDSEEINIDFKSMMPFFKRFGVVLLILIPLFLALFFRMQPAMLPAADDWARTSINNNIRSSMFGFLVSKTPVT